MYRALVNLQKNEYKFVFGFQNEYVVVIAPELPLTQSKTDVLFCKRFQSVY